MKLVKDLTYDFLTSLIGKTINFQSDCELFDNFNVTGKLQNLYISGNEYIFVVLINGKNRKIGSNMKSLKLEIIS